MRLRIGDQVLTAVITRDAVNELKLRRGDEAVAIIKSTEVMIGRTEAALENICEKFTRKPATIDAGFFQSLQSQKPSRFHSNIRVSQTQQSHIPVH